MILWHIKSSLLDMRKAEALLSKSNYQSVDKTINRNKLHPGKIPPAP